MEITISEEQKEEFLREYKQDFKTFWVSKGSIKSYYEGICVGIELVLTKLGIINDDEITEIQAEISEALEERGERNKFLQRMNFFKHF